MRSPHAQAQHGQWRMLPKDFPPFTTVQGYFYDWRDSGLFERINFELLLQARDTAGRAPSPFTSIRKEGSSRLNLYAAPRQ